MYRYIGNKCKISHEIVNEVESTIGKSGWVSDLMCGTGSVSAALRNAGYNVIASDVMSFAVCHARVQLMINSPPSFDLLQDKCSWLQNVAPNRRYERVIGFLNALEPIEGYFYREFSPEGQPMNGNPPRKYFTSENARRIDAIRSQLREWEAAGLLTIDERALLKHDLIMAVNEIANISGTYGHYHSKFHNGAVGRLTLKPSLEPNLFPVDTSKKHIVMQGYAEDLAKDIKADLCYIDPPYMKRQYAANYHILETLARGDEPEAVGKSGLRPWRDQYSNFCSKLMIRDSFKKIFTDMNCDNFLISYSEDGLLSKEELTELFSQFGDTSLRTFKYKRFRSNNSSLGNEVQEYIFRLRRR